MAFDVYSLIRSEEIREYLRKNRPFTPLEQGGIIWFSFYPIEQKLEFMKQLLEETTGEERPDLEELVRLYEFIVNYIYHPPGEVIYMAQENHTGYHADTENAYRLSESVIPDTTYFKSFQGLEEYWHMDETEDMPGYKVRVDMISLTEQKDKYDELFQPVWFFMMQFQGRMQVMNFGLDEKWVEQHSCGAKALRNPCWDCFRTPLPFENGCRIKLQTPEMEEPVYGILASEKDCGGCWYHFLWIEDEKHEARWLRKYVKEDWRVLEEVAWNQRTPDSLDVSYPQINVMDDYLVYDWMERAEDQKE